MDKRPPVDWTGLRDIHRRAIAAEDRPMTKTVSAVPDDVRKPAEALIQLPHNTARLDQLGKERKHELRNN